MSIVANVVCRFGSWVVSDGRGRNSKDDRICSENIVKAWMINRQVCVGFTGILEVAEAVLNRIKSVGEIQNYHSDEIARIILGLLGKSSIASGLETGFLITGENRMGLMATYSIGADGIFKEHIPNESVPFCFISLSAGTHGLFLQPYVLNEIQREGKLSNAAIVAGIKKFCCDVADVDNSVNKNLSVIEIRK